MSPPDFSFDPQLAFARVMGAGVLASILVWPFAMAHQARTSLAWLRATIIATTGLLLYLRSSSAVEISTAVLLPHLHHALASAAVVGLLLTTWQGIQTLAIPRLMEAAGNPQLSSPWRMWCAALGLGVFLVLVFILGALPGALAQTAQRHDSDGHLAARAFTVKLAAARADNASQLCQHIGEVYAVVSVMPLSAWSEQLRRKLDTSTARFFDGNPSDNALKCSTAATAFSLVQAKSLVAELQSGVGKHLKHAPAPGKIRWVTEPERPPEKAAQSMEKMELHSFFKRAISSPLEHMGAVLSASDLATTFVLLGEFSAAILTLLDSVLRRVERGPLARRNSPEIDF